MKNEAEFKTVFKKSVRAQKGFCLSLAAPMIVGIPDLYVVINGFMPVLLEAKWLGVVNHYPFKRKIEYTEMQKKWIVDCCEVRRYSALGLIGYKYGDKKNSYEAHIQEVVRDKNYIDDRSKNYVSYKDGVFDVIQLFEKINVPKVNGNLTNQEDIGKLLDTLEY